MFTQRDGSIPLFLRPEDRKQQEARGGGSLSSAQAHRK